MRNFFVIYYIIILLLFSPLSFAYSNNNIQDQKDDLPVIREKAENIIITVTALQENETFHQLEISKVALEKENFRIFLDKVEQNIISCNITNGPATIVFVYDISGSMGEFGKNDTAFQALSAFAKYSHPKDRNAIVTFNDKLSVWPPENEFADIKSVRDQLLMVKSKGLTDFLGGVYLGIEKLSRGNGPRILVIISDGMGNKERYTMKEVKEYLKEKNIQIHAFCIYREPIDDQAQIEDPWPQSRTPNINQERPSTEIKPMPKIPKGISDEEHGRQSMKELAEASGGIYLEPKNLEQLEKYLEFSGALIRRMFELSFEPSMPLQSGKSYRVKVEINRKTLPKELRNKHIDLVYRDRIKKQ